MVQERKMSKLSVEKLKTICEHFNLALPSTSIKRKAPYMELIESMVKTCTCYNGDAPQAIHK